MNALRKNTDAKKSAISSKINLIRAQKLKFLQAFDPEKNINVSNVYARYVNYEQNSQESDRNSEFSEENQSVA